LGLCSVAQFTACSNASAWSGVRRSGVGFAMVVPGCGFVQGLNFTAELSEMTTDFTR
jgi:hypothetical protein